LKPENIQPVIPRCDRQTVTATFTQELHNDIRRSGKSAVVCDRIMILERVDHRLR